MLPQLGVAFADDLLATWGVEEAGQLLEQDPFPLRPRQGEDMLPSESADEQAGGGLQFSRLFGNETQLEVRDSPLHRDVSDPVEEFAVLALGGPCT